MKPVLSKNRKFGVEVEMTTPWENVLNLIQDKYSDPFNIKWSSFKEQYYDSQGKTFDLKFDSSTGCEIATPILSLASPKYKQFRSLVKFLKRNKVEITKSDSIHIHMACPDIIERDKILTGWMLLQYQIHKLFPKHRRTSHYCEKLLRSNKNPKNLKLSDITDIFDNIVTHHMELSFIYWDSRQTIEFRMHEGSLDFDEIDSYIKFLIKFVEFCHFIRPLEDIAKVSKNMLTGPADLNRELNITEKKVAEWVFNRFNEFN